MTSKEDETQRLLRKLYYKMKGFEAMYNTFDRSKKNAVLIKKPFNDTWECDGILFELPPNKKIWPPMVKTWKQYIE